MDEMTHTDRDAGGPPAGRHDAPARVDAAPAQARLPFDQLPPVPMPYDDEADVPIGFALTARARRTVAPQSVPALSVIPGAADPDANDTRPARARALRRAGFDVAEIARQLRVDDLLVRAWAGDLPTRGHGGAGSRAARAAAVLAAPASPPARGETTGQDNAGTPVHEPEPRLEAVRRAATDEARDRLSSDAVFAMGVGMLAGLATVDRHAVMFRTARPEVAGRLVAWACEQAGADLRDVRVVLRLGTEVASDLARHHWSSALGLGMEQLAATRWRQAPTVEAEEALVRLAGPEFAARVAGWCDALLRPEADPADVAF